MGKAVVRIIENIFENNVRTFDVESGNNIETIVREYTYGDEYTSTFVECYDCDTGKTTFVPMADDAECENLAILVNGKDKPLDYIVHENDVVEIIFLPLSSDSSQWSWTGAIVGSLSMSVTGSLMGFTFGGIPGFIIGAIAGGVIGFVAGGLLIPALTPDIQNNDSKSSKGLDSNNLPDIRGSQNQSLTNNVFPFVIGKHLVTPFIIDRKRVV